MVVSRHLTFDTGALIALERRRQRMRAVYERAVIDGRMITAPVIAVAEWWRGASEARRRILGGLHVEPVDSELARIAGEAVARVRGAGINDALVMATAARRGGIVYTSDIDDLERLRVFFPSIRVLHV